MQKNTGLKRILLAGVYAVAGWRAAARHEAAFRQEAIAAAVALPVALFVVDVAPVERVALVGTTLLVLICELLNSAIEAVVDRIGPELHELSGRAKDMGSGAVLVALLLWVYAWIALVAVPALAG